MGKNLLLNVLKSTIIPILFNKYYLLVNTARKSVNAGAELFTQRDLLLSLIDKGQYGKIYLRHQTKSGVLDEIHIINSDVNQLYRNYVLVISFDFYQQIPTLVFKFIDSSLAMNSHLKF